jgi:prepilin-type processing-associated H-X9-DG protein
MSEVYTYLCPSSKELNSIYTNGSENIVARPYSVSRFTYIAYGYNYYYIGGTYDVNWSLGYRSAKNNMVKNPSMTVVQGDSWIKNGNIGAMTITSSPSSYYSLHDRHGNGANILWADGHVKHVINSENAMVYTFFDRN